MGISPQHLPSQPQVVAPVGETEVRADLRPAAREELLAELDRRLSASGIRHKKRNLYRRSLAVVVAKRSAAVLRRLFDICCASFLLLIFSPLLLVLVVTARLCGGGLRRRIRLGRWATHFEIVQLYFPPSSPLAAKGFAENLPALVNVIRGDMALIGPRPISPNESEAFAEKRIAWKRYNLRPGLLSLWWVRKRANIAFASEASLDLEYVETTSFWGDLGIAVRAIPASFLHGDGGSAPSQIRFLGLRLDNLTMAEASAEIVRRTRSDAPVQVCFVNADCVNLACTQPHYKEVLQNAGMVLPDGIGVRLAGMILNQNVRENVNGTDMLPFLCAALEAAGLGVFLLGGKQGVAADVAAWMHEHYPKLEVSGHMHGYFSPEEEPAVMQQIRNSGAAVLLVAFGAPRQDEWIAAHREQAGVPVMIGVGGLFDFYSGRIPRAPVWIRELGMEWFYRFYQEPRRMFRRYFLGNAIFLRRVIVEKLRSRGEPVSPRITAGRGPESLSETNQARSSANASEVR